MLYSCFYFNATLIQLIKCHTHGTLLFCPACFRGNKIIIYRKREVRIFFQLFIPQIAVLINSFLKYYYLFLPYLAFSSLSLSVSLFKLQATRKLSYL